MTPEEMRTYCLEQAARYYAGSNDPASLIEVAKLFQAYLSEANPQPPLENENPD